MQEERHFLENGVDHPAHTVALQNLKAHIEANFGAIDLLILEGESTGTLVLRIAEQNPDLAEGVIALGAWVNLTDPDSSDFLSAGKPQIPSILMSNTSEALCEICRRSYKRKVAACTLACAASRTCKRKLG